MGNGWPTIFEHILSSFSRYRPPQQQTHAFKVHKIFPLLEVPGSFTFFSFFFFLIIGSLFPYLCYYWGFWSGWNTLCHFTPIGRNTMCHFTPIGCNPVCHFYHNFTKSNVSLFIHSSRIGGGVYLWTLRDRFYRFSFSNVSFRNHFIFECQRFESLHFHHVEKTLRLPNHDFFRHREIDSYLFQSTI